MDEAELQELCLESVPLSWSASLKEGARSPPPGSEEGVVSQHRVSKTWSRWFPLSVEGKAAPESPRHCGRCFRQDTEQRNTPSSILQHLVSLVNAIGRVREVPAGKGVMWFAEPPARHDGLGAERQQ